MKYSIIVPAYNEEKRIGSMLQDYCSYFSHLPEGDVEIIVVMNGCRDNTLWVVQKFAKRYPLLRYVDIWQAIRKGGAVIEGIKIAQGEFVGYADADGATQAHSFYALIQHIGKLDGVIASRWIKGAVVEPKQPFERRVASRAFNYLVKILLGLNFYDTQCGCKLFRRDALMSVLPFISTTRWAFDVDILYHLHRKGFRVKEIPTIWRDRSGSSLNVKRVSLEMLFAIIRLRLVYSPFRFLVGFYNKIAGFLGIRF